jgi:Flp pilus assembly protein CpaB
MKRSTAYFTKPPAQKNLLISALLFGMTAVAGTMGFYLFSSGVKSAEARVVVVKQEPPVEMVDVLIPLRKIEVGIGLEPSMFRKEMRPQVGVSGRSVGSFEQIRGKYARALIVPGQPLHEDFLTDVRPGSVITTRIPEGFRAVTIRVDVRSSVEGWTSAGSRVDVHWLTNISGEPAVVTIVENAEVLSAERQTDSAKLAVGTVPSTVTLLVSADDSKRIQLGSNTGSLTLSLRGDFDSGKGSSSASLTRQDLLGPGPSVKSDPLCQGFMKVGEEEFCVQSGRGEGPLLIKR